MLRARFFGTVHMCAPAICLGLLGLLAAPVLAQDTLTFDNGDVLTGRIKRLERGELTLDIPIADGDVYADWRRVVLVESQRVFQFQTTEGERFLGRIQRETDPEAGTLVVEFACEPTAISQGFCST